MSGKHRPFRSLTSLLALCLALIPVVLLPRGVAADTFGTKLLDGHVWAPTHANFGDVSAYGLSVYSNGPDPKFDSGMGSGYGIEWQCVEFAQRWAAIGMGETVPRWKGVGAAFQMWSEGPYQPVPFLPHANGGADAPRAGDLIVFAPSENSQRQPDGRYPAGHVAVVWSVTASSVWVVEQNWYENSPYTPQPLPISGTSMPWRQVASNPASYYPIYGWLRPAAAGPTQLGDLFLYYSWSYGPSTTMFGNSSGTWSPQAGPNFSAGWSVYPGHYVAGALSSLFLYNPGGGNTYVEVASGNGGWNSYQGPYFSPGWTVYTGDFNGDGLTDLFLYNQGTGATYVELANGQGGWTSVQGLQFITGWTFFPGHYCDNDSQKCPPPHSRNMVDLFLYNFSTGWSRIETADGSGHWRDNAGPTFSNAWTSISTGYFFPGEFTDLFLYVYGTGGTYVEESDGHAGWRDHAGGQNWTPGWLVYTGDFNGDGLTDLFLYNFGGANAFVELANGDGTWNPQGAQQFDPNWTVFPVSLDGRFTADLFLYNTSSGANEVDQANGNGGWSRVINPQALQAGLSIFPGNFDSAS